MCVSVFSSVTSFVWLTLPTLTCSIASLVGFGANLYQERLYRKRVARRGPEARLYASLIGGLVFPAGAFILAFSQGRGHWMGPVVGVALIFTGVYTIYLAVFSYLADCYTIVSLTGPLLELSCLPWTHPCTLRMQYASSALSGQSLCRNLMGFSMPLFTTRTSCFHYYAFIATCTDFHFVNAEMYNGMGYQVSTPRTREPREGKN